ncbi:MAG TPA: ATP-binding protein [Acidimicrobiia bacterium]
MFQGLVATRAGSGLAAVHRYLMISIWVGVPFLAVVGLILDKPTYAVGLTSIVLVALALGGMTTGNFATVAVSLGLVAAAGVVVAYADGATVAHFAFFVAVGAVSSYRRSQPMAAAVFAIAIYHLLTVPVGETLIHTGTIAFFALVLMAGWRLTPEEPATPTTSSDRFRIGFEEAPIGMAVLKPSGEFLEVNKAMVEILGYPPESVLATNISRFVHADDRGELGHGWEEMGNSSSHSATKWMRWLTADGPPIWARISLSLVPKTVDQAALVILQLEDASSSYEEKRRLESLLEGKDRFVAAVGEEIRRPLGLLIDLSDRAGHRHIDMSETLPRIEAHAREVASIVDDLVLSAKADTIPAPVMAHQLDAEVLCRDVVSRTQGGQTINLDIKATKLWADPTLTRRIVANLVSNAIKFGGPEVGLHTLTSGPDTVIQVTDNGPEMPAQERERVFSGDLRHGQPVTRPASVGLSMTVGRHLARQMDGDIEYRRTADGRNVFELRLPSEPFSEIPRPRPPREVTASAGNGAS